MITLVNPRAPAATATERMANLGQRVQRLEAQIATGQAFTEAAEDPPAANRAALLERLDQRLVSDGRTIDRATARLNLAEVAAAEADRVLMRARELAILGSNGTMAAEDRAAIAVEVRGLREQLLALGNSRDEAGRYLFAGARDGGPPYVAGVDGVVTWVGFGEGPGADQAGIAGVAVPVGPALFGTDAEGAFHTLAILEEALVTGDAEARAAGLETALLGLVAAGDRVVTARARMGTSLARLEGETERVAAQRLETARALAAVKGLDLASAIAELEALRLSLSAAREVFGRVNSESLFDRLG
jgi:flagellar hook-associated protein 3 FlgL